MHACIPTELALTSGNLVLTQVRKLIQLAPLSGIDAVKAGLTNGELYEDEAIQTLFETQILPTAEQVSGFNDILAKSGMAPALQDLATAPKALITISI